MYLVEYLDRNGSILSLNDYVEVITETGKYKGYINSFQNGRIKVNCLPGEFRVTGNEIILISKL